ncbi:MAG: ATP-binding protein [Phycisphaerales bacterium]|nr:ATP-binding protein [Phycisphaerales bacterium]
MTKSPFHGLRPVLGKSLQRMQLAYVTADMQDKRMMEMAAELLRRTISPGGRPLLDPPDKKQADGEVWLGRIVHGEQKLGWAGLNRKQLTTHMGVFGTTGAGKTTMCVSVLLRLMELGVSWISLDPKRSLRCMNAMPTPRPVTVRTTGRPVGTGLRFNPFAPPPGTDPQSHTAEVIQLLSDTWHGGPGIASLLERAVGDAWKTEGVPTFEGVLHALDAMSLKHREGQWMQSARRILTTAAKGRLGRVFAPATSTRDPIDAMLNGWTIIETDGLTREEASFLVSTLLLQIHQRLLAGTAREQLRLAVLIDEAEQLLVRRDAMRESLIDRLIRTSRESSLGLIVASQSISRMTPTILQNLGTLIAMRAHHRDDVSVIARMLMLPEHATPLIGTLGVGQAVCRIPHWNSPVCIEAPTLQLPKGAVDDAGLTRESATHARRQQLLDAIDAAAGGHPGDPGCSTANRAFPSQQAANRAIPARDCEWSPDGEPAGSRDPDTTLSSSGSMILQLESDPDLQALLGHIATEPFTTVTAKYAACGFSRRRGNTLRQQLETLGLVTPVRVTTPRGVTTLLELTQPARGWLKKRRAKIAPLNGGIRHAYWQHECKRLLEEHGWEVKLEWKPEDTNHAFDVAAWKENQLLLIEVETGMSRWRENLGTLGSSTAQHRAMLWIGDPGAITTLTREPGPVTIMTPAQLLRWDALQP